MDDKLCDLLIDPVCGSDLSLDECVVVTGSCCVTPILANQDWTLPPPSSYMGLLVFARIFFSVIIRSL